MRSTRTHRPFHIRFIVLVLSGCVVSAVPVFSQAATYGLHLGSRHDSPGFNDSNLGVYAYFDNGLTLGTFENSVSRQSVYVGKTWQYPVAQRLDAAVTLGAITGYDCAVSPMLVPSLAWQVAPGGLKLRSAVLFKVNKNGANAIHLMLEKEFR